MVMDNNESTFDQELGIERAAIKKGRGRPKGSKTKAKTTKAIEQAVTEPEAKTIRDFLQGIINDEEYRKNLKTRVESGKLSPTESRWIADVIKTPQEKVPQNWEKMLSVATEQELELLAELFRRAIALGLISQAPKGKRRKAPKAAEAPSTGEQLASSGDGLGTQELRSAQELRTEEPKP